MNFPCVISLQILLKSFSYLDIFCSLSSFITEMSPVKILFLFMHSEKNIQVKFHILLISPANNLGQICKQLCVP